MTYQPDQNQQDDVFMRRIIVQLHDFVKLDTDEAAIEMFQSGQLGPWKELTERCPKLRIKPRWRSLKGPELEALVARAMARDRGYRPGPLSHYFVVTCPNDSPADEVAKALGQWETIRRVWVDPGPIEPPLVIPGDDPRWPAQGYLDPAPSGIDAEFAWSVPGGAGAGQGFVDLEQGWTLNHEDLAAHGITLISGVSQAYHGHGTAVLGEVSAVDNSLGCVGIAPELSSVRVVSQYRSATNYDTADAILDAAANMDFGHVLLLEAQTTMGGSGYVPVEVYDDVYEMIRLAVALGVTVVEAGANGGEDLDAFTNLWGEQILNPASPNFRDSGAIIVGAAGEAVPHTRLGFSCFGARVDCYAWGEGIETTGDGWTGTSTSAYTTTFGGTSGASPIISGAALAVQGVVEAALGLRFSPAQMRAILTNPATSTPSANPALDRIGVMPDLRAIISGSIINARPDVYLRDFVGDNGDPHSGAISASPDVILTPIAVADPTGSFGPMSGTENSSALGYEATAGQNNFIYVRTKNRGGSDALNTTADIYWSPVSTLVTPDLWTPVGSVTLPNVPVGDVLTVSNGITWAGGDIPAPGHYCFVAILGHPGDPGPAPVDFLDWDNFRSFIRNNNNVTWRNFNVVPSAPPPGGVTVLPFLMAGAFDRRRLMRLELCLRLPQGGRAHLRAPEHLVEHLVGEKTPFFDWDGDRKRLIMPINPHGCTRFADMKMPVKARFAMELLVHVPKEHRNEAYLAHAAQYEGEEEVGRVTWRLTPEAELKQRDKWLKEQVAGKRAVRRREA